MIKLVVVESSVILGGIVSIYSIFAKVTSFPMTSAAWRFHLSASSTGFPKASREARNKREARELETSEKCERGMMGTSALHEGGVMEAKLVKRERLKKIVSRFGPPPPPSFLSPPLSSIINSNFPQKSDRERLGTRQPKCYPAKNFTVHLDNVQVFWVRKRAYCFWRTFVM